MTTEEKAKAYDEALKKIQPLYEQAKKDDNPIWSTYEYLFPELRESEDERIRKFLIDLLSCGIWKEEWPFTPPECVEYLEKQKEQKPAEWSERDEKILASVMSHIADSQCFDHFHDISKEDIYTWLKSLRPQPKCEWSEEDEENFKWFDKFFRAESIVAGGRDIPQDKYLWFKSFRNRPKATDNWKPSEEQMDCLAMTLTSEAMDDNVHDVLSKFYDNLKKLMEE